MDPVVDKALGILERRYVEPARVDERRMLDAATGAAARAPGSGPAPQLADGASLVARLAPPISELLERGRAAREASAAATRALLLSAVVGTLDPYSRAVSGFARRRMVDRFTGHVSGVGLRIGRRGGRVRVLAVNAGSPAERGGIRPGEILHAVDDEAVTGSRIAEILLRLRGPSGSSVVVTVEGASGRRVQLVRQPFQLPSVRTSRTADGVLVVHVSRLSQTTPAEFDRQLAGACAREPVARLVLDLRGNQGGSMLAAGAIADRFVSRGVILEALDREDRPVPGLAHRVEASERARPDWPMAVLVDGRTASSAELLAAALTWELRAVLVGSRTLGKNLVLKAYHHDEADLTLLLAVAYLRATGRRLPSEGLVPDVEVEPAVALERATAALPTPRA